MQSNIIDTIADAGLVNPISPEELREVMNKQNDLYNELSQNFIEYAVAVNTDRAIPSAYDGLKPVAKRILYEALIKGFSSSKPHVKCANIVGNTMADMHPHGDSSIYGALVRLSQNWVMRYPLIDFHGSNGNRDGDGPAAYRYTEARLSKLVEDGMFSGIKKNAVDFVPNYSETMDEPVSLPSIFPNLLCNPNTGIGVAMACGWLPHNLNEVAQAINDYIEGKTPMLPGPDFPTGGVIINKNDILTIMRTGHGSVKVRGKYITEGNNIVFTEIPYGVTTEDLMNQIGAASDEERIKGITHIRNESNKKGFRLVIECDKSVNLKRTIDLLFKETDLQTSISYNQVALIDKTPTELNLEQCIKIYVDYNSKCIVREAMFDIEKATRRLHIIVGLLKALDIIDEIIAMIKASESSSAAKATLISKWGFSEEQAKAILDMKLSRLAKLEKEELENEKKELEALIIKLKEICENPIPELQKRLAAIVAKYGDARRTELVQLDAPSKEEKEIAHVEPEKCVVIMTEDGYIKRIPATSFRAQKRNGKGIKTKGDITSAIIRTNTIDSLMVFTNKGRMYRILVDDIPVGSNTQKGASLSALIEMENGEVPTLIYSIYRDTDAQFILFTTQNGIVKKTPLSEYTATKRKSGIAALNLREGDQLVKVNLIKDEEVILLTEQGKAIRFKSSDISPSSRASIGIKGISLATDDKVVDTLVVRDTSDKLAVFSTVGLGKKIALTDLPCQGRAGKGLIVYKDSTVVGGALVQDEDMVLVAGDKTSICILGKDIPLCGRAAMGNAMIKQSNIVSISKV